MSRASTVQASRVQASGVQKLIGHQVSVRQVSRASIVSGVKGPRSFKRQMSLRQKSIFGRSMSKNLWQCMSGHVCLGVVSLSVKKDPPQKLICVIVISSNKRA